MPLIDYKLHALERKYDVSKTEEKRKFVAAALQVVRTEKSESVREELLKKLREKTEITYNALERDLNNLPREEEKPQVVVSEIREASAGSSVADKAIRFVLAAKLFSAPYAKGVDISWLKLSNEVHRTVAEYLVEKEKSGDRVRPSELFEFLDEDCAEFNEILDLNYGDKLDGEIGERFFNDSIKTLQKLDIDRKIEECNEQLKQEDDVEKRKQITMQIATLVLKKKKL
jgi:DNA primase